MSRSATHWVAWLLLAMSIVLSAVGQLCMKAGMQLLAGTGISLDSEGAPLAVPALLWTGIGLAAYGASMVVWLGVLTRLALSYAYPLLSVSYILVYIGATHWARIEESATPARTIGTLLIALGVGLVCLRTKEGAASRPARSE
jgi:undecaprenyl phosphate-alpha-L-ara4N flippase subunit ArnF